MSYSGNQYLLPFLIKKNIDSPNIYENEELALVFYLLTKDLKIGEKITSFSKLLWPLLSIQGTTSTHVILDGLFIFSKQGKFTNAPRQPLIGHILRNVDGRSEIELMDRIVEILTYKDTEAEEVGVGEESEYQNLKINALLNPQTLEALSVLLPNINYQSIKDFSQLDSILTTETALDIAEKFRSTINTMKGNASRWKAQVSFISENIKKWTSNLNAKLKDIDLRYKSQISKTMVMIDEEEIKKQIEIEHDKIDLWKVEEKKKLIENATTLFKTFEINLQEITKKNTFFTSEDLVKSKVFENAVAPIESHFNYLKEEGKKLLDVVDSLKQKFNDLKNQANNIDSEAATKLGEVEATLNKQLEDRNKQLSEFENEKEENISNLKALQSQIESSFNKIKEIIQTKTDNSENEAKELVEWSINDSHSQTLFSMPIQWFFMPLYAMFIENEDLMEERMNVVFPGYTIKDPTSPYEDLSESFVKLRDILKDKIEKDVKTRSNFEFTCESKNLIEDPNLKEKIELGISKLRRDAVFSVQAESKVKANLNLLS